MIFVKKEISKKGTRGQKFCKHLFLKKKKLFCDFPQQQKSQISG